jgi:hypothetical protein
MKPPKNADELTLRWWSLTAKTMRNRLQLHLTYRGMPCWRDELKIGFAVLRGAFVGD